MRARLGQHFLKNKGVLQKITLALDLKKDDVVIEIGPGHGELTNGLKFMNKNLRIIAIEKDPRLANDLRISNVEVVNGDALRILKSKISNLKSYKLVGNIPYYITGKLLRILSEAELKPSLTVLTIQKEVAERICARRPKMNLLAAVTQFWAEPEIISLVSRKYFSPPPEVDSAIIKLVARDNRQMTRKETDSYYKFAKTLFKQPRKNILNNLLALGERERIRKIILEDGIDPKSRPQNLSPTEIEKLAELFLKIKT